MTTDFLDAGTTYPILEPKEKHLDADNGENDEAANTEREILTNEINENDDPSTDVPVHAMTDEMLTNVSRKLHYETIRIRMKKEMLNLETARITRDIVAQIQENLHNLNQNH